MYLNTRINQSSYKIFAKPAAVPYPYLIFISYLINNTVLQIIVIAGVLKFRHIRIRNFTKNTHITSFIILHLFLKINLDSSSASHNNTVSFIICFPHLFSFKNFSITLAKATDSLRVSLKSLLPFPLIMDKKSLISYRSPSPRNRSEYFSTSSGSS